MSEFSPPAVVLRDPGRMAAAEHVAAQLGVAVNVPTESAYELIFAADGVALGPRDHKLHGPVKVDFSSGASAHRRVHGGGNGQLIAKAVGLKGSFKPRVFDATAGLGGDAFVLAGLGAEVTLAERSPVAFALLEDGLHRARQLPDLAEVVQRMRLLVGDSRELLQRYAGDLEVVYLDPMFPPKTKQAASGKAMQAFHAVIGGDLDADLLLETALAADPARIVVKRPRHAPPLAGPAPNLVLEGKSGRFDVYARRRLGG